MGCTKGRERGRLLPDGWKERGKERREDKHVVWTGDYHSMSHATQRQL